MIERSRKVVLLIDYDNLQICASRDTPGRDLQLTPVVQLAQRFGTVILARAYAEWNLSTERLAVYKAGIEPAFAPVLRTESDRSGKSLADTVMVAEGMDMLWTLSPDVVVLATSDKDLIPLVRVAKQRGAFVVVLGSDFTAIPLREMADEHITYKQLITDPSGRFTTEAAAARTPAALPEPARRRTRERNGREPRPAPAAGTAPETRASAAPSAPPPSAPTPSAPTRSEIPRSEAPLAAAAAQPAVGAEPVAPVGAGTGTDADGQPGSRRRRRRGSRRRSERLAQLGESGGTGGAEPTGDDADADSDFAEDQRVAPTAERQGGPGAAETQPGAGETTAERVGGDAETAAGAAAGGATPAGRGRRDTAAARAERRAARDAARAQAGTGATTDTASPESSGQAAPTAEAAQTSEAPQAEAAGGTEGASEMPAPRERRARRTRRTTAASDEAPEPQSAADAPSPRGAGGSGGRSRAAGAAEARAAAAAARAGGSGGQAGATGEAEAGDATPSTDMEPLEAAAESEAGPEAANGKPARRPRRVASAARGRTRPMAR